MLNRFVREARAVALRAQASARSSGSSTVEAEHVLLALAEGDDVAGRALSAVGLAPGSVRAALERDLESLLAGVGVNVGALVRATAPRPSPRRPRWGRSAKAVLELALRIAQERGDRRIGSEHILLGLLRPDEGTVPRILRREGVDAADLEARVASIEAATG